MAISSVKRHLTPDTSEDEGESSTNSMQANIKRIKQEVHETSNGYRSRRPSEMESDEEMGAGPSGSREVSMEDEQGEPDGEDEDEDDEMESEDEEARAAARDSLEAKDDDARIQAYEHAKEKRGKIQGRVSDAGIMKSVNVQDFMCHRNHTAFFGARMNFVIGHNGSGKSAILTAIAVALGGKAIFTGRGQGLKDLIRKGADKASISLILANEGPEAFRPDVYGSQIVIDRTIDKSGSSTWKFRATKEGRIIANKREELVQIVQHFNISVDSPLVILTQDNARSFLQNATDEIMYKLFIEGTQLSALTSQYDHLDDQATQLRLFMAGQEAAIPLLESEVAELHRKAQASRKMVEMREKIHIVRGELVWAYVKQREDLRDAAQDKAEEARERLEKAKEQIASTERESAPLDNQVKQAEADLKAFDDNRKPAADARRSAGKKVEEVRSKLAAMLDEINNLERKIAEKRADIMKTERAITEKQVELTNGDGGAQQKLRDTLKSVQTLHRDLQRDQPRKEKVLADKKGDAETLDKKVNELNAKFNEAGGKVTRAENDLAALRRQSGNRLSAFGTGLEQLFRDINSTTWTHKPIGPLGMYVHLEDMAYKNVFHSVLGQTLCGFAVQTREDKVKLQALLKKNENLGLRAGTGSASTKSPLVIQYPADKFDFSRGNLENLGPTMLSKLRIDNENVLRILVTQFHIEGVFVSPSIRAANTEMDELFKRGVPRADFITGDLFRTSGQAQSGNRNSSPLEDWRGNMLFSRDVASDIREVQTQIEHLKSEQDIARANYVDAKKERVAFEQDIKAAYENVRKVRGGVVTAEKKITALEAQIEDRPDDAIGALEMSKKEDEAELATIEDELVPIKESVTPYEEELEKREAELAERDRDFEGSGAERKKKQEVIHALTTARAQKLEDAKHWNATKINMESQVQAREAALGQLDAEVEDFTLKAARVREERFDMPRKPAEVQKEKDTIEKTLADAEKRTGVRGEDIMPAYISATKRLDTMRKNVVEFGQFLQTLEISIRKRRLFWLDLRSHIAVQANTLFMVYLRKRELDGRLIFNHSSQRLSIRATNTSSHGQSQNSQVRFHAPKNLSGGERSFTTIALLISLWDTLACPVRLLDEWDVFLDAGNKALAGRLLADSARESEGKQFLFISPTDFGGLTSDGIADKTIRMPDPIRNQGTLNLAPAATVSGE